MKQYNRARERKNILHSLLKETMMVVNGSGRVQIGRTIERGTSDNYRGGDVQEGHQPSGSCSEDRRSQKKRESDRGSEKNCVLRLYLEDGREYRPGCGDESQKNEGVRKAGD